MPWLLLLLAAGTFEEAFRAGLVALNKNDLAAAESRLEEASKLQPGDARVWLALARVYWKLGKQPSAQSAARRAETNARDAGILHGLAIYYAEASDFARAADLETRYAETAPDAWGRAAQFALLAGHSKDAASLAKKALAAEDRPEFHNLLGKAYEAAGDLDAAIPELRAAVAGNRYEESYYADLVQALLKQQKFEAALEALDSGRKVIAKSPQFELASGVAYYGLRRFPQAIDAFLATIRLDPTVEQPYVFLGKMLDQAEGKLAAVTEAFAAFHKRAPEHYLSSFLYAKALALNDPARAETLLQKSISLNPGFWESHFDLGIALERRRRFDDAAKEIRRAAELNPDDAAIHYRLARLYDRLGKTTEARAERDLHQKLTPPRPPLQ